MSVTVVTAAAVLVVVAAEGMTEAAGSKEARDSTARFYLRGVNRNPGAQKHERSTHGDEPARAPLSMPKPTMLK